MGCHVTKKPKHRTRRRLVTFVSWVIPPGQGKSHSFRHTRYFCSLVLTDSVVFPGGLLPGPCVPQIFFFGNHQCSSSSSHPLQVTVEMTSATNSSKHVHTCKDAEDINIARAARMAANSRSWLMLPSIKGIYTDVFSLWKRMPIIPIIFFSK